MTLPVDPARYAAFLSVMAVMAITPGPANLFAIATGMEKGKAAALIGVAGMNTATLVWFLGAAMGLGVLVAAFPLAFQLLAVAGALYVAWLGVRSILGALKGEAGPGHAVFKSTRSAFRDGFVVQIANPKALLFFVAVLPPFLDTARPMPPQLAMFAAAVIGFDLMSMSAYGLSGAALANRMNEPGFRRGFGIAVGVLLLAACGLILTRLWQH
ncbi:MAG: LysE family translocator [Caulobacter sp.]|nr:LysE family translocator [Caulobacter sp.]